MSSLHPSSLQDCSICFPIFNWAQRHKYSLSTNLAASCACIHLPAIDSPAANGNTPAMRWRSLWHGARPWSIEHWMCLDIPEMLSFQGKISWTDMNINHIWIYTWHPSPKVFKGMLYYLYPNPVKRQTPSNAIKIHVSWCHMMPEVGKSKRDVKVSVVPKRELKLAAYLEGRVCFFRWAETDSLRHQPWLTKDGGCSFYIMLLATMIGAR